jgi:hypothetical protein
MTNKFVSSADKTSSAPWIFNGSLFIYSENRSGPRTERCGTPCFLSLQEEIYLFYFCNQFGLFQQTVFDVLNMI